MCLSTFQPSARHPWIHLCLAQNSQHSCASSTPSTVSAEAAAAGQAGASPDQAVSAGHPHTPQAPPEPLTPCCPRQTLLPCGQEGQEPSCHIAGQTHSCIHSCSTCLALGSGVSRPTRKHAAPCMQACLSWPLCHACLQHEVSLLASVQGSKPTRHGCTDMLHWRSMPMLLDDSHMAKHETCQPPPPPMYITSLTTGHKPDPSEVTSSVLADLPKEYSVLVTIMGTRKTAHDPV